MGKINHTPSIFGATLDQDGARFAVYSKNATAIDLCLFDEPDSPWERRRIPLHCRAGEVWEVHVPGIRPGQFYGYRADGPFAPQYGHRFNRAKLLMDPWARAMTGEPRRDPALFGYVQASCPDLSFNGHDSACVMPRSVVVESSFDWRGVRSPAVPWSDTVIYECHVKGLTRLHPEIDPSLRGTYLGLAAPPMIEHLRSLGVTAVQLLPVHQVAREPHLMQKQLANYWGYSSLGYFAPHAGYATAGQGEQVSQFKTMVRELHRAGIEVILDVVYNHTAEGDHLGPTLAFRGLDNSTFYRLRENNRRRYVDYSGCGNALDLGKEVVRDFVLDSLRYWVGEMQVDGFRFDLAPALARHGLAHHGLAHHGLGDSDDFNPECALFQAMASDPLLSRVKLIAEPWDLGSYGYQLGQFPAPWAEWNDRFRDANRLFWHGGGQGAGELAARLGGSEDLFQARGPLASIHFVTCHDGFTLRDLTSYEQKHNRINHEENRDGHDHNLSRNWGAEGGTDELPIRRARNLARRSLLATVFLSRGVPLLLYGDEVGRTQQGNNNAYCQDNEISWIDWSATREDTDFIAFVRRLTELRRRFPALRRETFEPSVKWWRPDGWEMKAEDWDSHRCFGMTVRQGEGELLVMVHGGEEDVVFNPSSGEGLWIELLDTARPEVGETEVAPPFQLAAGALRALHRTRDRASSQKIAHDFGHGVDLGEERIVSDTTRER